MQKLLDNVNVNEYLKRKNINDNVKGVKEKRAEKVQRARRIATHLVEKFGGDDDAKGCYKFFLQCAWHHSEDEIWTAFEDSHKKGVRQPIRYFIRIMSS